jgi:organic radical activating enzyme
MKLRYSEAFYSVQGEGKFVGVPSVFLRTFGCNFRCKNFGRSKDEKFAKNVPNPEVQTVIDEIGNYKEFNSLPIVHTGCDTYASIYPQFKRFMQDAEVDEVVDRLLALTPNGVWLMPNGQDIHLILTGGEPLLGWQKLYIELFNHPRMKDLKNVTFETNGTQALNKEFEHFVRTQDQIRFTFSCSPKLSVSGESWSDAINPNIVKSYYELPNSDLYLKFVVNDDVDVDEVSKAHEEFRLSGIKCPVYTMPLGGRFDEYKATTKRVAELAMARGWRYTPRLHVDIFGNAWGT